MAELKQFFPSVQPWVNGCPDPVTVNAIREAVRLVCDEAPVWRESQILALVKGISLYELDVSTEAELVTVESVKLQEADLPINDWRLKGVQVLIPEHYASQDTVLAEAELLLRPSLSAANIPDSCFSIISHVVPYGARWQLLDIPGQKWSDPLNAEKNRRLFYQKLSAMRAELISKEHRHQMLQAARPLA
ncbi:hypothetical protein [Endozoicomonas arenosclerae]|uniref:hypothetical protein n=1 Tax=Endozoicomonas arenosclerae TaxID=1633495 RepID=UPI000783053D|nr:hypothetical protein [Endozoicomonas arenosclerae]